MILAQVTNEQPINSIISEIDVVWYIFFAVVLYALLKDVVIPGLKRCFELYFETKSQIKAARIVATNEKVQNALIEQWNYTLEALIGLDEAMLAGREDPEVQKKLFEPVHHSLRLFDQNSIFFSQGFYKKYSEELKSMAGSVRTKVMEFRRRRDLTQHDVIEVHKIINSFREKHPRYKDELRHEIKQLLGTKEI